MPSNKAAEQEVSLYLCTDLISSHIARTGAEQLEAMKPERTEFSDIEVHHA